MSDKRLGKITCVRVGLGGYQEAELGLSIEIGGDGWGVMAPFVGTWARSPDQHCKWTAADQDAQFAKAMRTIGDLLRDAKRMEVHELVGVPVECVFEHFSLKSWRILKEVL